MPGRSPPAATLSSEGSRHDQRFPPTSAHPYNPYGVGTVNETGAAPLEQALERYAHFLQRTREMGVVGHRGGLKATGDLLQMCDLEEGQRILEVGCGSGHTACTAAKQHQVSVVAVDLESHLLAHARERARSMRVADSVALARADARRLPFTDASLDGVICESVLAFLEDKAIAVKEFHRVLTPGGFLVNNEVTFLKPPPEDFLAAIRGTAPKVPGALAVPVDHQEHQRLLEEAGFVSVQVETGDVSVRQDMLEQMQVDGFRALKPFFASIFDREMRNSVHKREMREAQRTFDEHTGYGLYFARKPAEG
jgi:ubiquinone/menaquinone biosynthesis C-methylase UbiE